MNKFLIKTILFVLLLLITILFVFSRADGYTDPFYLRFTTPQQSSLILGTSRAAQGIQPQTLNKFLKRNDIFNYSFTIAHSPYGPAYLNSIKKKLNHDTKNGIFILTIDPWSISSQGENPNDTCNFREQNLVIGKLRWVNMNPNIPYLMKYYNEPYKKLIFNPITSINTNNNVWTDIMYLHRNGWLEITIQMDSASVSERIKGKIKAYKEQILPLNKYSSKRLKYFIKTIDFLKDHGEVYIVRLPIHPQMMQLDDSLIPEFDEIMTKISSDKNVPYLNLTNKNETFRYTDGNHLYKDSGAIVTKLISDWIQEQRR